MLFLCIGTSVFQDNNMIFSSTKHHTAEFTHVHSMFICIWLYHFRGGWLWRCIFFSLNIVLCSFACLATEAFCDKGNNVCLACDFPPTSVSKNFISVCRISYVYVFTFMGIRRSRGFSASKIDLRNMYRYCKDEGKASGKVECHLSVKSWTLFSFSKIQHFKTAVTCTIWRWCGNQMVKLWGTDWWLNSPPPPPPSNFPSHTT